MIPILQVGSPDAFWAGTGVARTECYGRTAAGTDSGDRSGAVASIAPGGVRAAAFRNSVEVIRAAFEEAEWKSSNPPKEVELIHLGYSEAFENWRDKPLRMFYGTSTQDRKWLSANRGTISDLVVASIAEKIALIRSVGGPLQKTRAAVYADLFEPCCWPAASRVTQDVPSKARLAGLGEDLVFVQWWYHTLASDGTPYEPSKAFAHLGAPGFSVIYMSSATDECGKPFSFDCVDHMRRTVRAARTIGNRASIIGYAAGHWCQTGYGDGTDPHWSAIEMLPRLHAEPMLSWPPSTLDSAGPLVDP